MIATERLVPLRAVAGPPGRSLTAQRGDGGAHRTETPHELLALTCQTAGRTRLALPGAPAVAESGALAGELSERSGRRRDGIMSR